MILKLRTLICSLILSCAFLLPSVGHAINLNILNPNSLGGALPDDVASAAIKTFGIYLVHRPYEAASSIFGESALEFKIEVSMIHIGSALPTALAANGMAGNNNAQSIAIPMAKIHFRKAISKTMDMGISGLYYDGQQSIGTDLKIVLNDPEDAEGVTTAIRLGYTYASASLIYLKDVHVYSPEFVASRKLDAAEPYLGMGGRYIVGTISVPFHLPPLPKPDLSIEKSGSGFTAYAFVGVTFRILGPKGFIFGMEGSYDMSGFSTLGTQFGVSF